MLGEEALHRFIELEAGFSSLWKPCPSLSLRMYSTATPRFFSAASI